MTLRLVAGALTGVFGLLMTALSSPNAPPPPFSPYGIVKVNGANIPLGTQITAWCSDAIYGQTTTITLYNSDTWYSNLDVSGDDPDTPGKDGCAPGETVRFNVGGLWANQTAPWSSSGPRLDLTASGTPPTPTPTPTATAGGATNTPTASPTATATATSTSTPPATRTPTVTHTATRTATASPTATRTPTTGATATNTPTSTPGTGESSLYLPLILHH